jgi:hypothetical protein
MNFAAQYIPDIIGATVQAAATKLGYPLYYQWGHYADVLRIMTAKDKSITQDGTKYPLVWLRTDFIENVMSYGGYASVNFQLFIIKDSLANYTVDERRDNTFLPVLYPIYNELINQITKGVPYFGRPYLMQLQHQKIDHAYWGKQDNNGNGVANLFNDVCDVIEIKNLKLNIDFNCPIPKLIN